MRSNYLLYLLAAVFFIITAVSLALVVDQAQKSLWVVTTVVLGLFSLGLGYYQRPKHTTTASQPAPAAIPVQVEQQGDAHVKEAYTAENVERPTDPVPTPQSVTPIPMQVVAPIPVLTPPPVETSAPSESELMRVKGIGEKRATQLNALGVNNLDDLAKVSADDLAKDLKISPKITRKWIDGAKELSK